MQMRFEFLPSGSLGSEVLMRHGLQVPRLQAALEVIETPAPWPSGREVMSLVQRGELVIEHLNVRVVHEPGG